MGASVSDNVRHLVSELEEASEIEGTELGQWWGLLASIYSHSIDCGSPAFRESLDAEIRSEHKRLKEEFRVVESTETRTVTYRELRHESEWEDE